MRAITIDPGRADSAALEEMPEPAEAEGAILADGVALGICGTDAEIVRGDYGEAPEGSDRLILGHESLGRVREAPEGSGFAPGDLVVGIVRRPDPVPCPSCAAGEWDFCRNGQFTERGIKARHGYGSERWRIEPEFAVKLDPELGLLGVLMEPTTVVAKAWEQIDRILMRATIGPAARARHRRRPDRAACRSAGAPARLRGSRARPHHRRPEAAARRRPRRDVPHRPACSTSTPRRTSSSRPPAPARSCSTRWSTRANGIVCLTGISSGGRPIELDAATLNRTLVLENDLVFGSVNANRRHYEAAVEALARADRGWLERIVTRRVPLDQWHHALEREPGDIKVVVELGG